jgi:hypothetical protein
MVMKKILLLCFVIIYTSIVFAEPAPFGLEIKKATYEDTKKKYSGSDNGITKYSLGKVYQIEVSNIDMEGIESVDAIFDQNDKLVAVFAKFSKARYDALFNYLNQRYKLTSNQDAFVGNRYAIFRDGDTKIVLDAPHMSFSLSLNYLNDDFAKLYVEKSTEEEKEKEKKEMQSL